MDHPKNARHDGKKNALALKKKLMVPRRGLEPPRPEEHKHLKLACLPISPPGLSLSAIADQTEARNLTFSHAFVNKRGRLTAVSRNEC